jgi:hypothetical protein
MSVDNKKSNSPVFNKFIEVMEIAYAVLMTWGFARLGFGWDWSWKYVLAFIIALLVLVRFFFAVWHNLRTIAIESKNKPYLQRSIFFVDIPFLILHSLIYFRMCYSIAPVIGADKNLPSFPSFYYLFFALLLVNVLWLGLIQCRLDCIREKGCDKFSVWIITNCFVDMWLAAKYYLGLDSDCC